MAGNYLFLAKTIREQSYYRKKVVSAVNTNSCIVVDTEREMELINSAANSLCVDCECIYMDEFIRRKNSSMQKGVTV